MSWQTSMDLLEETLAASAEMQTLLGAANATEAKARIYQDALPPPAGEVHTAAEMVSLRPHVLISTEDAFSKYRKVKNAVGVGSGCWNSSGSLWCAIRRNIPSGETPEQAQVSFRTAVETIIDELCALTMHTSGDYLNFDIVEAEGPWRVHQQDLESFGDHDWVILRFMWGPQIAQ